MQKPHPRQECCEESKRDLKNANQLNLAISSLSLCLIDWAGLGDSSVFPLCAAGLVDVLSMAIALAGFAHFGNDRNDLVDRLLDEVC